MDGVLSSFLLNHVNESGMLFFSFLCAFRMVEARCRTQMVGKEVVERKEM
jgi:hypothetical protein